MKIKICRPGELTGQQTEHWRSIIQLNENLRHPQLTPDWAAINENAGLPVEIAELQDNGNSVFFAFSRLSRSRATPISGLFSDRQALIASPGFSFDVLNLLNHCRLKRFTFDHVSEREFWVSRFPHETDTAFTVKLPSTYDDYWNDLQIRSRSWCQQIERKQRKLIREVGPLRFEFHTESNTAWQALFEWKQKQVAVQGQHDVFSDERWQSLMRQTVKHQSQHFSGILSALFAGCQLVAVHLGQRSNGCFNAWIPAYHPEFSQYSPGAILHLKMLSQCFNEGITEIDLGRGENHLKRTLATETTNLAIGAIDGRQWRRVTDQVNVRLRNWIRNSNNGQSLIRLYRKIRNQKLFK